MAFEKFVNTHARLNGRRITVWKRGQIGISRQAVIDFGMSNIRFVVLYFDPDTNRIGIELTNDEIDGVIKLHIRSNSVTSFSAIPFMKQHKIDYSKVRHYELTKDSKTGLLVATVNVLEGR